MQLSTICAKASLWKNPAANADENWTSETSLPIIAQTGQACYARVITHFWQGRSIFLNSENASLLRRIRVLDNHQDKPIDKSFGACYDDVQRVSIRPYRE
jgi:hypothetical protein